MKSRFRNSVDTVLDWSLIVTLAAMSLLVAANVFCRFVLNFSIYWGDELALVLMVWLTFMGAAVATREQSHYVFSYLINRLKGLPLKLFTLTRDLINIAVILILGYFSARAAVEIHSWILPAMEISRSFVYAASPLGCVFMLYYSIELLLKNFRRL